VVTAGGVPQFVRMIPVGGEDISRALTTRLELAPGQAESVKMQQGLSAAPPTTELEMQTNEIIRATSHEMLNSLRNTLNYYINQHPTAPPQAIVVSGGGARLTGLAQALSEMTRLQVVAANAFSTVDISKSLQKAAPANADAMTVALGLALGRAA
jgi:type IV pilus assembly protein PilM